MNIEYVITCVNNNNNNNNNNMCAENLDSYRVPNHHLVRALNACFFFIRALPCMVNHVRVCSHSLAKNMAHIAQKYLSIPSTSVQSCFITFQNVNVVVI